MKETLAITTNYPLHILNWLLIKMFKNKLVQNLSFKVKNLSQQPFANLILILLKLHPDF